MYYTWSIALQYSILWYMYCISIAMAMNVYSMFPYLVDTPAVLLHHGLYVKGSKATAQLYHCVSGLRCSPLLHTYLLAALTAVKECLTVSICLHAHGHSACSVGMNFTNWRRVL